MERDPGLGCDPLQGFVVDDGLALHAPDVPGDGFAVLGQNVSDLLVSGAHPCDPASEVCRVGRVMFLLCSYNLNCRPSRCDQRNQKSSTQLAVTLRTHAGTSESGLR